MPGEGDESDVEPFEGVVGLEAEGSQEVNDDEPIIEDADNSDGEHQDVSDPECEPAPLNPVLKKDAIPCPTKNCIHRKKNRGGNTSNVDPS